MKGKSIQRLHDLFKGEGEFKGTSEKEKSLIALTLTSKGRVMPGSTPENMPVLSKIVKEFKDE